MENYDDDIGNYRLICECDYPDPKDAEKTSASMSFTLKDISDKNKAYLRNLPKESIFEFNNKKIRFVRGSIRLTNEYPKQGFKEADEVMNDLFEDMLVWDILIYHMLNIMEKTY
jgi:hypothetical protein